MKLRDSLFILAIALPVACQAAPVTYDFTVNAIDGPRAGATASGYFTYDDTIVQSGGGFWYQTALITDLSFSFDGLSYDETTANTGLLGFDTGGALIHAMFGSHCTAGSCGVDADVVGFFVSANQFAYSLGGGPSATTGIGNGFATLTLRNNGVPEPATLALAALALAAAGACSARGRKARAESLA